MTDIVKKWVKYHFKFVNGNSEPLYKLIACDMLLYDTFDECVEEVLYDLSETTYTYSNDIINYDWEYVSSPPLNFLRHAQKNNNENIKELEDYARDLSNYILKKEDEETALRNMCITW